VTDKIALVTGASRGLGALIASGLAEDGATVVGVARTPIEQWDSDDDRIQRRVCDVTDESAVKRLFSELRKQHGRLDILINNAGAFSGDLLLSATSTRFLSLLNANLVSAHVVSREAAKLMRTNSWGRVVSISSIATSIPLVGNALYASSKIGVEALMRDFALEFRGSGLTFNSIAVSFVEHTGMVDALKPEARANYEARLLVPRPLQMSEILAAIAFLLSPDAGAVTGQVIALGSPY
jgi:NAD(P)-dependent dehydrogenase (short-subunit alcohol dehydrogenase family)